MIAAYGYIAVASATPAKWRIAEEIRVLISEIQKKFNKFYEEISKTLPKCHRNFIFNKFSDTDTNI